ncbi:MAG: hypothetical protein ACK47B_22950 [Armatimonadota bacterium]
MPRGPKINGYTLLAWATLLGFALLIVPRLARILGGGGARLVGIAVLMLAVWVALARSGLLPGCIRERDGLSEEEEARLERLDELHEEADQMELTLKDLRDLSLSESDQIRARWAALDLEEALERNRQAVAEERAALLRIDAVRWADRLEVFLSRTPDVAKARAWLDRIPGLQREGDEILARLSAEPEVAETAAGRETRETVTAVLAELSSFRADLLARLARHLSATASEAPALEIETASERLRELVARTQARQEVGAWLKNG